jgi:hypothetical protein
MRLEERKRGEWANRRSGRSGLSRRSGQSGRSELSDLARSETGHGVHYVHCHSPLPCRPQPDNLPYGFEGHRVLERAEVSGFPAFGRCQDRSAEDFA